MGNKKTNQDLLSLNGLMRLENLFMLFNNFNGGFFHSDKKIFIEYSVEISGKVEISIIKIYGSENKDSEKLLFFTSSYPVITPKDDLQKVRDSQCDSIFWDILFKGCDIMITKPFFSKIQS